MLELGPGSDRRAVCAAFLARRATTIRYQGVLGADDVREALLGVRDAGWPRDAEPLLAWLASHPNAPEDVQRALLGQGSRDVLRSLCLNPNLHEELRQALLVHDDLDLRQHAGHVFAKLRRH